MPENPPNPATSAAAPPPDERTRALEAYKKKLKEYKEVEAKLKACLRPESRMHLSVRLEERELNKAFDKSENDVKALQSVGQIVGEVLKQLGEEKC